MLAFHNLIIFKRNKLLDHLMLSTTILKNKTIPLSDKMLLLYLSFNMKKMEAW